MTPTEQAVIDAARALVDAVDAIMAGTLMGSDGLVARCRLNLRSALAALDSEPDYRERMARLYRGEDK
jgi:hypothetical protein